MKLLLRILAVLVLLVVVALGAALLALPRLLDDESVRERIQQAARDALGRELRYERLELGFLPPSLRAVGTVLSGEKQTDPPLLEAREIGLRIALLPLLFRSVVVDSLVVEGATLRLTRTADGIALPEPKPKTGGVERGAAAGGAGGEESGGAGEDGGSGFALAVREVDLRDSSVELTDRAVRPAVVWDLRDIEASLRGQSLDAPIDLDLDASLGSGGRVAVEGAATTAGRLDLVVRLSDVALAPLVPYLGGGVDELTGSVGGTATLVGPSDALEKLEARLSARDVSFRREDLTLRGPVDATLDVEHPTGDATGRFELDLGGAQLAMSGTFTKPPGTAASVTGRIAAAKGGGLALEDVKLLIKNFEARGRVGSLDPVRAELDAAPFDLSGWGEIVPALADASPTGRVGISKLRYTAEPPALFGDVQISDVAVHSGTAPPLVLKGLLRAEGDRIVSEGLVARAADQTLDVDARLDRLFTAPRYQVDMKAKDADSNALVSSLLAKPDTLYGPLGLDASLRGELGGDVLHSLAGRIDFGILNGRLVGVSLLKAVTQRLGAVGNLAIDLGRAFGGRDLQRFYGDEFEKLSGVLDIAGGIARTDDLRFVYRGYTASLRGTLGLADLALDMKGDLTIAPELDAELAQELSLPDDYQPRARVIPLASVGGTLDAPRVRLAEGTAVRIAAAYAGDRYGDKLRKQVEKELGEGSGALVDQGLEILQGVLGGGKSQQQPAPTEEPAPAPSEAPAPSQP